MQESPDFDLGLSLPAGWPTVALKEEVQAVKVLCEEKEREAEQWRIRAQLAEEKLAK